MQKKKAFFVILVISLFLLPNVLASPSQLLALINAERARLGRDPLIFDARLNTAALGHSQDMLDNDFWSHTSFDGRTPGNRLASVGYTGSYGENIAVNSGAPNANTVFNGWMNSPDHYYIMTHENFNIAGIGIAQGHFDYGAFSAYPSSTLYTLDVGYSVISCTDGDTRQCGSSDVGRCEFGTETCSGGSWGSCVGAVYPIAEDCENGIDDDCDGVDDANDLNCCDSHDSSACYNNDVYWYDSCGQREDRREDCGSAGCESGACCTSHVDSICYNNDVYWYSSCNVIQEKREECFADGCFNGECVTCDSQDSFACYNHDVYWYDSCNSRESKKEECGTAGCNNNACCTSHTGTTCYNGDVYWHSSCNYIEEKIDECYGQGCVDSTCVTCDSHDSSACYNNDVYWYDSCDRREEKKNECGTAGCDSGACCTSQSTSQCYANDVYWYSSCGVRQSKKEECYTDGCLEGECIVCEDHASSACYANDVYWYDSCDRREDKKQECGSDGCNDGECLVCEEHNSFACYANDVYWYDSCDRREEKKEDCPDGCSEGACIICEEHYYLDCYGRDSYWYDSCGRKENKEEDCPYGCSEGRCNSPPCGDNDKDGYVDEACGGDDCDDTNKQIYPGSIEICNSIDEDCDGNIDDDCKENLIINSPEQDEEFNTRRVKFELDVTHLNGRVWYDTTNNGRWRTFCTNPSRCTRYISLPDGYNEVDFKLEDFNGDESDIDLNIFVDSRKPRIRRQEPRNGRYGNGDFKVTYSEDYPESVDLYLSEPGSEEFDKVATDTECEGGKKAECTLEYDVSEFEDEQIQYYFAVSDKVTTTNGRAYTITVDTTDPSFTSFSFEKISETREKYQLQVEVDEYVKLEYQYPGLTLPKRLCSKCDARRVNFYFREKPDYVDIFATDMAGNDISERVDLE